MSKETRIGALWSPRSQNENAPLGNGHVLTPSGERIEITVWKNKWKHDGEKTPDYYIEINARESVNQVAGPVEHATNKPAQEVRRVSPFPSNERPGFDFLKMQRDKEASERADALGKHQQKTLGNGADDFSDDIPF